MASLPSKPNKVTAPKGPVRRINRPTSSAATGEKRPAPSAPSAPPPAKKPRQQWWPKAGDPARARWTDDEYHRVVILRVLGEHQHYDVEYVASPDDDGVEPASAVVAWKNLGRPFNLSARPPAAEYDLEHELAVEERKVLAKQSQEDGGDGSWLPAAIKSRETDDEGKVWFVVEFLRTGTLSGNIEREHLDPLFSDSPCKYDANGVPVFPTHASAGLDGSEGLPDYQELMAPVSRKFNYYGQQGYRSMSVGMNANGTVKHAAISDWQNITMMAQTTGEVGQNASKKIVAQYERSGDKWLVQGWLQTGDLPEGVLMIWTDDEGSMTQFVTDETRIVWWQLKGKVGVWFMVEELENSGAIKKHVFRMRIQSKYTAINLAKMMSTKLKEGRTRSTGFTSTEERVDDEESDDDE
ncbi:hypothetical protein LTR36_010184 [Oleoguttula mirabilis]|uniref:Uncharacterized protein n=1 Tax=Oleoguttula mirabilis TaxID=1507867 RepID=A0AAV9JS71_9PEZI|nr:hypothetical protein LTR36_010184 [Oleoguttula mirabilis]